MSGYFARLTRKTIGMSLPRANGVSQAVTPLEHSVGVETAPVPATDFTDTSPNPAATAATPSSLESDAIAQPATHTPAASLAPVQAMNGAQPTAQSIMISPAPVATSSKRDEQIPHAETSLQGGPETRPFTEPQLEHATPVRSSLDKVAGMAAPPSLATPDTTDLASRTQPAAPQQPLGDAVPPPASAETRSSRTPTERPQPRASVTPTETAARDQPRSRMARSAATRPTIDVRIGSLRIEVLPPPPPSTVFEAPRPQPAPAAKQEAPSNFRPSRHYLRYGG